MLFEAGYSSLAIRDIATACGIGTGTVYNYFENKEMLVAHVMLEDWLEAMSEIKDRNTGTKDISTKADRAEAVFEAVKSFSLKYEAVWSQYAGSIHAGTASSDRHPALIEQVCRASGLDSFTVEVLVHFATISGTQYEDIRKNINKLF